MTYIWWIWPSFSRCDITWQTYKKYLILYQYDFFCRSGAKGCETKVLNNVVISCTLLCRQLSNILVREKVIEPTLKYSDERKKLSSQLSIILTREKVIKPTLKYLDEGKRYQANSQIFWREKKLSIQFSNILNYQALSPSFFQSNFPFHELCASWRMNGCVNYLWMNLLRIVDIWHKGKSITRQKVEKYFLQEY